MDVKVIREEQMEVRRGPWTMEEDFTLFNYIARHGEGRWNSLSRSAGLKRTGKSCRLRWLNYLRPDVRRGNITPEEQLLILELHSQWGNRWSKIAKHLPGRTDNEIKNYWRTRVQKHAKQIKCDVNSKQFKNTVRYLWMPTLIERIQAATSSITPGGDSLSSTITATTDHLDNHNMDSMCSRQVGLPPATFGSLPINQTFTPENSSTATSSNSFGAHVSLVSDLTNCFTFPVNQNLDEDYFQANQPGYGELLTSSFSYFNHGLDFQSMEPKDPWVNGGDLSESIRNVEDFWLLWHHLTNNI